MRLRREDFQTSGWTLNISRGGARLVVEESVELGAEYEVEIGEQPESRGVRIVWVQDEADGQIVGIQFLDSGEGSVPPPPSSPVASPKSKT